MKKVNKILIIRFSSIGDMVLTLPALKYLQNEFPQAQIDYLTKERYREVLSQCGLANIHTISTSHFSELFKLAGRLSGRYDMVLDLHASLRSRLFRLMMNGLRFHRPKTAVFKKPLFKRLILVYAGRNLFKTPYRVIDNNLQTAGQLAAMVSHQAVSTTAGSDEQRLSVAKPWFALDPAAARTLPADLKKLKQTIIIMPAATWYTKAWPEAGFSALIVRLLSATTADIVLIGGRADIELAEQICSAVNTDKHRLHNACGRLDLHQSAALVKQSQLLITNDTGMMHIAEALGVRVAAIFGSTTPSLGFGPVETTSLVFENTSLPCRPCTAKGRPSCPKGHFKCMTELSVDELFSGVTRMLPPGR